MLPNGCSSEKLMLHGGSRACNMFSQILYPKRIYFASLTPITKYRGSGQCMPLNKVIIIT
jgi:hypothetical protein